MTIENGGQFRQANILSGFFLDLRSLALFRIGIGIVLLINLTIRAMIPDFLPADGGIFPSEYMRLGGKCFWSFHFLNGHLWFQYLLLILNAAFCFLYLVGLKTSIVAPIVTLFTLSLNYSNCLSINSGDVQLALVLLISCFLPISRFWSLDQALSAGLVSVDFDWNRRKTLIVSVGSTAFIFQIIWIYWSAVSNKSFDSWVLNADAVWGALSIDYYRYSVLGNFLMSHPGLMKLLSRSAYFLQMLIPFLIIFPDKNGRARLWGVLILLGMHIGFLPVLKLGLFPWISIFCLLALLPPSFYKYVVSSKKQLITRGEVKTIYYDDECRFCLVAVKVIVCFLAIQSHIKIVPARINKEANKLMSENNSWVIESSVGNLSIEYSAFLELLMISNWARLFYPILSRFHFFGRCLYRLVADHRVIAWKIYCCLRPRSFFSARRAFASEMIAAFFILLSLLSIFLGSFGVTQKRFNYYNKISFVLNALGVRQSWKMFAPYPLKKDGWLVLEVKSNSDQNLYLVPSLLFLRESNKNPSYNQEIYGNQRSRKYFANIRLRHDGPASRSYLSHLCSSGRFKSKMRISGYPLELSLWDYPEMTNELGDAPKMEPPVLIAQQNCD